MIQHHYDLLIHPNEDKRLKLHGADSTAFNRHQGILCRAKASRTKAEIMHAGQWLEFNSKRLALARSHSVAGIVLPGVAPKKPAFVCVHAVTFTV